MKIKVVHIITRLDLGGAQRNTLYTLEHLDRGIFEPVLLCGPGGILDPEAKELEAQGLRVRVAESLAREIHPLKDLSALFEIYRILREENPDIVHTHSSKAGILGRLAAALAAVPAVVHTYHGFGFHERQPRWLKFAVLSLERLAARWASRLIFVSEANRSSAKRLGLGRDGQSTLIRSGVKLAQLPAAIESKEEKKASLGARMHQALVVSVGNFKPQKNPWDFLSAAERTLQAFPDVRFLFVGDGPLRPKMEAAILAKGLHGKVLLAGWRRDVPEILAAADAFMLTSLWEGLPRALVEAMKSGLPCVCYAVDGITDIVRDGENGFLIAPGDWGALADKLCELLKDGKLRDRLGRAAAQSITSEFDIDEMVRRQEELYKELLAE